MFDRHYYEKEHQAIFYAYDIKYRERKSCLFEDGIVDPSNYRGILFLLKEAHTENERSCNLVDNLAKNGPWGMWHRVCEWAHGIEHTTVDQIEPFRPYSDSEKCTALSHLAVINVKKIDGTPTSDNKNLQMYVDQNKDLLRREIECVQPKIIVCGNTFGFLKTIFGIETEQKCDNWYYWLNIENLGTVLALDYYHPAAQYPALLTYYGITNIYQQALKEAK